MRPRRQRACSALAKKLLDEKLSITWWGNIRFEKTFTPELCQLLAESGCVAVSGGLEVASDRLLELMKKGVTVEQVARVTRAFTDAGIMVHAYLMYGFPTETEQDTIDALERVRQLFAAGCIQSAYWHRFAATAHSPIGLQPENTASRCSRRRTSASRTTTWSSTIPRVRITTFLGAGLRKALYNYMHGVGLDEDVRVWFEPRAPKGAQSLGRQARGAPSRQQVPRHHRAAAISSSASSADTRADRVQQAFRRALQVQSRSLDARRSRITSKVPDVYPAGRLDTDSEGLLLLTDDGALQARIAEPAISSSRRSIGRRWKACPPRTALASSAQRVSTSATSSRSPRGARLIDEPAHPWPRDPPIRYRAKIPTAWLETHAARRQEPPGAAHDGARGLPHLAAGACGHRQCSRRGVAAWANGEKSNPSRPGAIGEC